MSVVEEWSESPHKRAVSAAIEYRLMILRQDPATPEETMREAGAVDAELDCGVRHPSALAQWLKKSHPKISLRGVV